MVLLKFFGGPAKIVAKYGTQLPLMTASMLFSRRLAS
jgi:hypothetical protein